MSWKEWAKLDKPKRYEFIVKNIPISRTYIIPDINEDMCLWDLICYINDHIMHECEITPEALIKSLFINQIVYTLEDWYKED